VFYFRGRDEFVGVDVAWRSEDPLADRPPGERFMFIFPFDEDQGAGGVVKPAVVVTGDGTVSGEGAILDSLTDPGVPHVPRGTITGQVPEPDEWMSRVGEVIGEIDAGRVEKVVLARRIDLDAPGVHPFDVLDVLAERFPDTYLYGWADQGTAFIGASPELLIEKRNEAIRSFPLAGSAPRGATPAEDEERARALFDGPKERAEHRYVVDYVADVLGGYMTELAVEERRIVRLANIYHLGTEVVGTAASNVDITRIAAALHPTPAVAGTPSTDALRIIARSEPSGRGWYAGAIGWADAEGNGEATVALRSAYIRGSSVSLHAGAGIVHGSDPRRELAETDAKLRAVLDLLTGAG